MISTELTIMETGGAVMKRIAIGSDIPPPILKMPQRNWIESTLAASKSVRGHYFTNSVFEDLLLLKSS